MIYFFVGYIIFLLFYAIFSYVILYHLLRFGYKDSASSIMLVLYLIVSAAIIAITFILFFAAGGMNPA